MQTNQNLCRAKRIKEDNFYTMYEDVEKEMLYYREYFKNKVVLCNCDDPSWSSFWQYFHLNFTALQLKRLIATHFDNQSYKMIYDGGDDNNINCGEITALKGNGDFRSRECIVLLEQSDIIVTNPPFSLFREFIALLFEYNKQFLIIGNMNALKYKEIFPLIMNNEMWMGVNAVHQFKKSNGETKTFGNICWYTNLEHKKRNEELTFTKQYSSKDYLFYDTYCAIEVSKVKDIPENYYGVMGVPISFMTKYNPNQFEIIGEFNHGSDNGFDLAKPILRGKELFPRIAIRRKLK